MSEVDNITYPSIVFKIKNNLYAVNSQYITTLMQKPASEKLPNAPAFMTGVFHYRDTVIQMLDLRCFLGMETLSQEADKFTEMVELRKKDHVNWVDALDHSLTHNEPFKLATDSHQCAFGQWFDKFHTDNPAINFVLRKIEQPHAKLHQCAINGLASMDSKDETHKIMGQLRSEYMPQMLGLLDDMEKVVRESMYHEMVLVLSGDSQLGLVVDEVLAVSELAPAKSLAGMDCNHNHCISGVVQDPKTKNLILELDVPSLLKSYQEKMEDIENH